MKFTIIALALCGMLALSINQVSAQATFLGRELDSKKDGKDSRKDGKDSKKDGDRKDGKDGDDDKRESDEKPRDGEYRNCNGTVAGYNSKNGTFINCTLANGTVLNYTRNGKKDYKKYSNFTWSAANATTLIKTVQTPLLTSELVAGTKRNYVIGYSHVGKDVKKNQTINQTQAENLLNRDLKEASECVEESLWKKNSAVLTDYQNTALISFAQSVGCDFFERNAKKVVIANSTAANTFFTGLITKADITTSDYLTARRAAEKALFGIV